MLPNHLHFLSMLIHLDAPLDPSYLVSQMNKNQTTKYFLVLRTMMSTLTITSKKMLLKSHNLTNFKSRSNVILIKMIKSDSLVNSVWMGFPHNLIMNKEWAILINSKVLIQANKVWFKEVIDRSHSLVHKI